MFSNTDQREVTVVGAEAVAISPVLYSHAGISHSIFVHTGTTPIIITCLVVHFCLQPFINSYCMINVVYFQSGLPIL